MRKPSAPPAGEELAIDIDPSLIEEALAAVDRRLGAASDDDDAPRARGSEAEVEVEIDAAPAAARPAPAAPDEEKRRLQFRVGEQAEAIRKLERELARTVEARDALDRSLREARKAHGDLTTEFERYRARARKEADEAERRGEDKALRPLVDIYDNVERAWTHATSDPAQLLNGLQMIVEQFKRLLLRLGFERIDATRGVAFDPALHEAVLHVPAPDLEAGRVVDEVQTGFNLRGRLYRPARVTVSAPPPGAAD